MNNHIFLCKWSEGDESLVQLVESSFFSDSNGYKESDILLIGKMQVGDTLDLSAGISQYHEIQKLI